jgi:hypothetical protein
MTRYMTEKPKLVGVVVKLDADTHKRMKLAAISRDLRLEALGRLMIVQGLARVEAAQQRREKRIPRPSEKETSPHA